ncbi:hypothetical protein EV368DRAFT_86640 [Lentinula lateritia]|uniref:Uncharacterized protein n=1 Tax=Lentinula aff. lateritia TaxID=2804960 RepID=A0ACC1TSR3_9AGAR|nr:hypothetical protein F5876DRAFT_79731 [Lentinula aff. lateritia]KAJ3848415.1 hypothetical protein EV368DRAFT_86640 [Lentinula lateritia]
MHSGRKGSCVALWLSFSAVATPAAGGWPDKVVAPSAVPFEPGYPVPHALTIKEIEEVVAFKNSAQQAVIAGYDVLNIHAAHDKYGGSFENRIRLVLEVIDAVRTVILDTMPLVLCVSATNCLEHENYPSWKLADTIELAKIIYEHGVDVLDVSSGGQSTAQTINVFDIQSMYAKQVKDMVGDSLLVGCLGSITSGKVDEQYLQEKCGDMCFVGRNFLEKPGTAWDFAEELDESVYMSKQLEWPFIGRGKRA